MSRSFGDVQFKKVGMSAIPNIQIFNITSQDKFLLCGCDGFWSCFSPQDAAQLVSEMSQAGKSLKAICNRLVYMVSNSCIPSVCRPVAKAHACGWLHDWVVRHMAASGSAFAGSSAFHHDTQCCCRLFVSVNARITVLS